IRRHEQADRELAVVLAYEQLLARPACRRRRVAVIVGEQEPRDRVTGREPIQRLEPALQPRQRVGFAHCSSPSVSTRTPAARSFFSTHSSRVRNHCSYSRTTSNVAKFTRRRTSASTSTKRGNEAASSRYTSAIDAPWPSRAASWSYAPAPTDA